VPCLHETLRPPTRAATLPYPVYDLGVSRFAGTMRAAIKSAFDLNTVANDAAFAVFTLRRHCINRAFKAIKDTILASSLDGEGFVVVVAAY